MDDNDINNFYVGGDFDGDGDIDLRHWWNLQAMHLLLILWDTCGDDHDNVAAGIDDEDDDDNDVHLTFSCFSFPFDDSPARRQSSPLAVSPDKTILGKQ